MGERGRIDSSVEAEHGGSHGRGFFMPDDRRQALRVRRYLIAAGTSLLVPVTLSIFYWYGLLPLAAVVEGAAIVLTFVVMFYLLFRSGLNQRLSDPSLTAEQMGAAILTLAYIMYYAENARNALSLFYLAAMLFGVLKLDTVKLLMLAALALVAHATMLASWHLAHPGVDPWPSLTQLAVLSIVLPWFALMGGYVNKLRHRLADGNRRLQQAKERVEGIAMQDELTGVYNRRYLLDLLRREASRVNRGGGALAVSLFDVDHFKAINDTLGHAVGDCVLREFAATALKGLRTADVFGRYGGEEFLMIMPQTDLQGAVRCAERVRSDIENAEFSALTGGARVTVTAGVACLTRGEDASMLLARADEALYSGKAAGRNRVAAARPERIGSLAEATGEAPGALS